MSKPLSLEDIPFAETLQTEPSGPPAKNLLAADEVLRRQAVRYWLLHPLNGALSTLFVCASLLLPRSFVSNIGARLSPVVRRINRDRPFAKRIARNYALLSRNTPQDPAHETRGLAQWWSNIGRTYAEFGIVNELYKRARIEVEGAKYLDQVHRSGKPIIFCSVHLATWETLTSALQHIEKRDLISTFQPEPNRFTNRIVHRIRKARHHYAFPPGQKSAIRLHRLMTTGNYNCLFYVDEVRDRQIHLPLFNRAAPDRGNAVAAIKLANKCAATLLPAYLTRTGPARFKLVFCPPIERSSDAAPYDQGAAIKALNDVLEPAVLKHIEEWYMLAELRLPNDFSLPRTAPAASSL